jgi:hypothetical protein
MKIEAVVFDSTRISCNLFAHLVDFTIDQPEEPLTIIDTIDA